jgi:hypothetical protein
MLVKTPRNHRTIYASGSGFNPLTGVRAPIEGAEKELLMHFRKMKPEAISA